MGELTVQDNIHTEIKKVRKQIRKMPNWKYPGPDGVQGYWIKNLKKGIQKGNLMSNFRLIICLPLIWKLLTCILAAELYEHFEKTNSLPWEQNGCRKGSRGTKDQLLIEKMIVKDCKMRLASFAFAWIDYRKA